MDSKEIARRLNEEPWTGDMSVVDELAAPDYVGYDPTRPEPARGPAGIKEFTGALLAGYPDARKTIDQQTAEGEWVTSRWTGRGTHQGELMGIPPTGKQVTVTGITISRVVDGKVTEEHTVWDMLGMLIQLGVVSLPTPVEAA